MPMTLPFALGPPASMISRCRSISASARSTAASPCSRRSLRISRNRRSLKWRRRSVIVVISVGSTAIVRVRGKRSPRHQEDFSRATKFDIRNGRTLRRGVGRRQEAASAPFRIQSIFADFDRWPENNRNGTAPFRLKAHHGLRRSPGDRYRGEKTKEDGPPLFSEESPCEDSFNQAPGAELATGSLVPGPNDRCLTSYREMWCLGSRAPPSRHGPRRWRALELDRAHGPPSSSPTHQRPFLWTPRGHEPEPRRAWAHR